MGVHKFVAHGRFVQEIAVQHGWRPGARYTNLRDVRQAKFAGEGFLDIDWKNYCFRRHLAAAERSKPFLTVARDVVDIFNLDQSLSEAEQLKRHARHVLIVPKDKRMSRRLESLIPKEFLLGFSVPTRYGGTEIDPKHFKRPVHLLGGRPDVQRGLAEKMQVFSVDCNRFTLDARYGDYFDGRRFRPHPVGGYQRCLADSMISIDRLWDGYGSEQESAQIVGGLSNG